MQSDIKNNLREIHCPMMVSFASGIKDSKESFLQRWDYFDTLSERAKDVLAAKETAQVIWSISNRYRWSDDETENFSRIIRDLFFGKINNIKTELAARIPRITSDEASVIEKIVIEKIANSVPKLAEEKMSPMERLPFSVALKKYPQLGEQALTSYPIKTKLFEVPVKPSIKNWIMDYQQKLGPGKHDSIQRGNYIFQSENGKKLLQQDRDKLAYVLKCLDDESQVEIDQQTQQMVFPKIAPTEAPKRPTPPSLEIPGSATARPYQQNSNFPPFSDHQSATRSESVTSNPSGSFRNVPNSNPSFSAPQNPVNNDQHGMPLNKMNFTSPQQLPAERQAPVTPTRMPGGNPIFGGNKIAPIKKR